MPTTLGSTPAEAFADLSLRFTVEIQDLLGGDAGMRPSFLGHILVELLLDSTLIEDRPGLLNDYYRPLDDVENWVVELAVNRMQPRQTEHLALLDFRSLRASDFSATIRTTCNYSAV